jgi:catechol 2,3-dioxygenase-like lactoylglutathione lyase family enzyme
MSTAADSKAVDRLLKEYEGGQITRRNLIISFSALVMARPGIAQARKPPIVARALNHMTLTVSDPKRSLEFYQGLFGMPIQARQGPTVILRIGSGPQFMALSPGGPNAMPGINHFCMLVDDFNVDRMLKILEDHGVTKSDPPTPGAGGPAGGGLTGGPMKVRIRMRGEDVGGAKKGTPEMYVGDPDGIVLQLQDRKYCGGAGYLGDVCSASAEPAPRKGLIAARDFSHFTLSVSNQPRSMAFYQGLFGMPIQAHQGPLPIIAVGSGPQFLALAGPAGGANAPAAAGRGGANTASAPPRTPNIGHACLTMQGFNPDKVLKTLAEFGVKPRGDATGPVGPLMSYVSVRREDRGGSREGTPELYFTDPDGITIQLQDVSYCGGAGVLGNVCRP